MARSRKRILRKEDHFFIEWILLSTKSKMKQHMFAFVFGVQSARTLFVNFVRKNSPEVQCCCDERCMVWKDKSTNPKHCEEYSKF